VLEQLGPAQVPAQLHVTEEPELLMLGGLVVRARDRLDLRMIRGDPRAHEAVRRGQAVVETHRALRLCDPKQLVGRVEAAQPGPHDRDAEGRVVGHASDERGRRPVVLLEMPVGDWNQELPLCARSPAGTPPSDSGCSQEEPDRVVDCGLGWVRVVWTIHPRGCCRCSGVRGCSFGTDRR
jgi:hypothetical protein